MSLSEMYFLGLLGLVIFGPKKLISVGQDTGKMIARLKTMSSDFQSQLKTEISMAGNDRPIHDRRINDRLIAEGPVATGSIDKSMSGSR